MHKHLLLKCTSLFLLLVSLVHADSLTLENLQRYDSLRVKLLYQYGGISTFSIGEESVSFSNFDMLKPISADAYSLYKRGRRVYKASLPIGGLGILGSYLLPNTLYSVPILSTSFLMIARSETFVRSAHATYERALLDSFYLDFSSREFVSDEISLQNYRNYLFETVRMNHHLSSQLLKKKPLMLIGNQGFDPHPQDLELMIESCKSYTPKAQEIFVRSRELYAKGHRLKRVGVSLLLTSVSLGIVGLVNFDESEINSPQYWYGTLGLSMVGGGFSIASQPFLRDAQMLCSTGLKKYDRELQKHYEIEGRR